MTQQPKNNPIVQDTTSSNIARIEPSIPPHLTQSWVVWEGAAVIQTNGIKLDTGDLHDLLKKELESQKVPIDIFYTPHACWIIEGAMGEGKIDKERRARVAAILKNSIYTNMQFIAGIDYLGTEWANVQMMMIVQPEKPQDAGPRPIRPKEINTKPLIPNEAILLMIIVGLVLIFWSMLGNNALLFLLGLLGSIGAVVLLIQSNKSLIDATTKNQQNLRQYEYDVAEWERRVAKIKLEEEELKRNRLSRSFQWDDLRVMLEVMKQTIEKIVKEQMLDKGASVKETIQSTKDEQIIPESKKNLFDEF
ncbi:hypothetical protein ACE1CD_31720 [Aerosakkonema sp. BLCC-F183]|uniref:hypothetical protein n=1 Tax=Aerosakkonema sp. BLCC-F183 TaxID=3342834 RepID=UPI0035B9A8F3